MQKKSWKTCAITLLVGPLLLCGCISDRQPSPENNSDIIEFPNSLPAENAPLTSETTPSMPIEPPIEWDVSDVSLSEIDPNRKLISFTFDDAPARTLESLLAVFAAFNEENPDCKASATVFVNGSRFDDETPLLLSTAYAMGFELGNHTHSHYDLTKLDESTLSEEIQKTDELLFPIDGKPWHLLRAPFGKTNELVKSVAPVPLIDWTIDTLDWTGISADSIYRTVYDNRFSGAIVLMHDGYKNTIDAVKRLLPDLKADGYQVVSVSRLAKAHNCVLERGKTYIRARKQT